MIEKTLIVTKSSGPQAGLENEKGGSLLLGYRPEIDGLRAIAVLSVILFHFDLGLPGGFVGVDVFFVISGYLISGIIKRELATGQFSFAGFWERRVRRILPAAMFTALLTLLAGYLLLNSEDLKHLAKASIANAAFSSNFYFWKTIDYFTDTATGLPLLHTWSLAVEEQFYLLFPIALWGLYQREKTAGASHSGFFVAGLLSVSFLISVAGVYLYPQATFYLLPTRAWELLMGAAINYLPQRRVALGRVWAELIAGLGLLLIVLPVLTYSEKTPFPGLSAAVPCLGAALVIFANQRSEGRCATAAGRFLAIRPLVLIGSVSYSLYLFHWPVLVFSRYLAGSSLDAGMTVCLLVALGLMSWASLHFLEEPIRRKRYLTTRKSILTFAVASTLGMLLLGGLLLFVIPSRFADIERTVNASVAEKVDQSVDVDEKKVQSDQVPLFGEGAQRRISFLLLGDSHARMSIPAFEAFAALHHLRFASITFSSTQPLVGYRDPSPNAKKVDSVAWVDAAVKFVSRNSIGTVVLAAKWDDAFRDLGKKRFQEMLGQTIRSFSVAGAQVYIMLDVPNYSSSVPRQMILDAVGWKKPGEWHMTPSEYELFNEPLLSMGQESRRFGFHLLDPRPYLLDSSIGRYRVSSSGMSLYSDAHHLTIPAAREYLGKMLDAQFQVSGHYGQSVPPGNEF